jgi:hypothetical protein
MFYLSPMKVFFSVFVAIGLACGGQTTQGDAGGGSCTTNAHCPTGQECGYAESEGCAATGACFTTGALCNLFQPGCSCTGEVINIACNGLPNGYATAPLAYTGQCIDGAVDQ